MIYAVEGADCVGKTTLADVFRRFEWGVYKLPTSHITQLPEYPENVSTLRYLLDHADVTVKACMKDGVQLLDRCALSTYIYQECTPDEQRTALLLANKCKYIFVLTPPSKDRLAYVRSLKDNKDWFETNHELQARVYDDYYSKTGIVSRLTNAVVVHTHLDNGERRSAHDLFVEIVQRIVAAEGDT